MSLLVATLLAAAPSPCAPLSPAPQSDATAAAPYLQVARTELANGEDESAAWAFRSALELQPENAEARAGFAQVCSVLQAGADFDRGLTLFEAGRLEPALGAFEAARAAGHGAAAALMEGVCLARLGRTGEARTALLAAAEDPMLAPVAAYHLGLLALARGDSHEAAQRFEIARTEPSLEEDARTLLVAARHDGRFSLSATLEAGYDSNVNQSPGTTPFPSGSGDGLAAASLSLRVRPLGASGPYAALGGGYRKLFTLGTLDTGAADGALGWQLGNAPSFVRAGYTAAFTALGTAPWLLAHVFGGTAGFGVGSFFAEASYAAALRHFYSSEVTAFSGTQHHASAVLGYRFPRWVRVRLGYALLRDLAATSELSTVEHGPALWLDAAVGRLRLELQGGLRHRVFDGPDRDYLPDLQLPRQDLVLLGALHAEVQLANDWAVWASVEASDQFSNAPGLSHGRVAASAGVRFDWGIP